MFKTVGISREMLETMFDRKNISTIDQKDGSIDAYYFDGTTYNTWVGNGNIGEPSKWRTRRAQRKLCLSMGEVGNYLHFPEGVDVVKVEHQLVGDTFLVLFYDPDGLLPDNAVYDEVTESWVEYQVKGTTRSWIEDTSFGNPNHVFEIT